MAQEYDQVSAYLRSRGYLHYEVSNFALPGLESRHNMRYWRGETVAALGPSATGLLALPEEAWRYKWRANGVEYDREVLGTQELRMERLYLSLRTHEGLDYISFWKTPENIQRIEELLTDWKRRSLALPDSPPGRAILTPSGFLLMDGLLGEVFKTFEDL